MNRAADVDGQRLTMPIGWWIWKYDDSSFHRKQFQGFAGGSKAMDVVALSDEGTLWLIEVKDYRQHPRTKPSSVFAEVAAKVRATLAGLAVARVKANDPHERKLAAQAMTCTNLRVTLQLSQPHRPSRLFPQVIDPMDGRDKMRRELRAVDAHPLCMASATQIANAPWQTETL